MHGNASEITINAQEQAASRGGDMGNSPFRARSASRKPVIEVNLAFAHVTDASLKELKERLKDLKQLTSLALYNSQVTDAGLKELKHLKQLTTLYLNNTPVTDAGLKELKDLKQLTTLRLGGGRMCGQWKARIGLCGLVLAA
jgi:hypothetical protein